MARPYFHWRRLLTKYRRLITLCIQDEGHYIDGLYVPGEERIETTYGAIIAKSVSALNSDGGNSETEQRILYTLQPIEHPLERVQVEHDSSRFHLTLNRDRGNAPLTGVWAYDMVRIQKFEKGATPTW